MSEERPEYKPSTIGDLIKAKALDKIEQLNGDLAQALKQVSVLKAEIASLEQAIVENHTTLEKYLHTIIEHGIKI